MYLKKLFQILVLIGLLSNSFIEISAVEVAQSPSFNSDTIVLQLRWKHQFQFAGYYAAKEMGFYKEAGLNVEIKEGGLNIDTVEEVIENRAQYGVTNSEILLHRLNGKPLVVLAAILQHSPLVLLTSRVGEITNPQDLVNRTVKMSLHPRDIELHAMFRNEGVSLNQINILDYPITYSDYFDSNLDAISAYITNEPYFLMLENRPYSVIKPASYGIDFYGDCFFTSEKEINDNPNRVEAFKAASIKGWHYALQHPEELIHIIRTKYNSSKSLEHMRYEAESIKKLIVPDLVEIGHMNKGRWASIANVFMQFDMIPKDYNMEGFIYQPVSSKESRRLKWLARIMFLILVAVGFVAVILYIFNKRLQKEIKERMLSETAYRESEAKFRLLIDNAELLVTIVDRDGNLLLVNDKMAEYHGGDKETFESKTFYDLYEKDKADTCMDRIRLVIDSEESRIYEDIVNFNTGPRWLITNVQPLRNIHDKVYAAQIISQDITKRKQAEESLKESEERYRAVSEITSDFAYAYEVTEEGDLKFQWVTDAIFEITGYTQNEISGLKDRWNSLVHPKDLHLIDQQMNDLITKHSGIVEYRIIKRDGSIVWLRDQAKLTFYSDAKRIYGAIKDISESKRTKEALQLAYADLELRVQQRTAELNDSNKLLREEIRSRKEMEEKLIFAKRHAEEANCAKTEFLANVSHELRTPMHHILNYSKYGMTKFHKTTQEKLLHYFTQIRKTGDRLMLLLNDLLDLSKMETGNINFAIDEIDLFDLVNERVSELQTLLDKKELTVDIKETKVNTKLECDPNKIGQVIQNLMSNAIKFTPDGKNISIHFEPSVLSIPTVHDTTEVVSAVSIFFGDQGIGIPERELETVFDKFVQSSKTRTGAGGTGLGLSISKEIIEAHGGVIYAENNADGGATFTFTLPYKQDKLNSFTPQTSNQN